MRERASPLGRRRACYLPPDFMPILVQSSDTRTPSAPAGDRAVDLYRAPVLLHPAPQAPHGREVLFPVPARAFHPVHVVQGEDRHHPTCSEQREGWKKFHTRVGTTRSMRLHVCACCERGQFDTCMHSGLFTINTLERTVQGLPAPKATRRP